MSSRLILLALSVLLAGASPARAISVVPPTFAGLVGGAESIIRGRVTEVEARWVDQSSGHRVIKTFVTVMIAESLVGDANSEVILQFLGGRVGVDAMLVGGMPAFRPHDRAWFFLRGNGRAFCPLYFAAHGAYLIRSDPATGQAMIHRMNGRPLRSIDAVGDQLDQPAATGTSAIDQSSLTSLSFGQAIRDQLRERGDAGWLTR